MTVYPLTPPTVLPSFAVQEAKEKRRKVCEAVWKRRAERYQQFLHKLQKRSLQPRDDLL